MSENSSKEKGFFNKLYSATDEAIKAMKKPKVKRSIKRKLESVYDDASSKIIDLESDLDKKRQNFDSYDANAIIESRKEIRELKLVQEEIKEEYEYLFDEQLNDKD